MTTHPSIQARLSAIRTAELLATAERARLARAAARSPDARPPSTPFVERIRGRLAGRKGPCGAEPG